MLKTMVLLFSLPLIAQSGVSIDFSAIPRHFVQDSAAQDLDKETLTLAVNSLNTSAQMNPAVTQISVGQQQAHVDETKPDQQLSALLGNINKMMDKVQ